MLAGRFMNQDRNWLQVVAGAAGEKMKKTLGCQEATKRTGTGAAACRSVVMNNKDGGLDQFLLQRQFSVLTCLVSGIRQHSFDLCDQPRET